MGGQLGNPRQPLRVRFVALQSRGQLLAGPHRFLEGADPCGDPPIELRQGHLQGEIEGRQADGALRPGPAPLGAAEHLQHRHRQPKAGLQGGITIHIDQLQRQRRIEGAQLLLQSLAQTAPLAG